MGIESFSEGLIRADGLTPELSVHRSLGDHGWYFGASCHLRRPSSRRCPGPASKGTDARGNECQLGLKVCTRAKDQEAKGHFEHQPSVKGSRRPRNRRCGKYKRGVLSNCGCLPLYFSGHGRMGISSSECYGVLNSDGVVFLGQRSQECDLTGPHATYDDSLQPCARLSRVWPTRNEPPISTSCSYPRSSAQRHQEPHQRNTRAPLGQRHPGEYYGHF